jgi:hypothetical protein
MAATATKMVTRTSSYLPLLLSGPGTFVASEALVVFIGEVDKVIPGVSMASRDANDPLSYKGNEKSFKQGRFCITIVDQITTGHHRRQDLHELGGIGTHLSHGSLCRS